MAFQLKRTFELIDPSTFDAAAVLRKAATEFHRDLTFDGDDDDLEEDIWLARRPAECDPDNHPAVLVNSFTRVGVWSQDFARPLGSPDWGAYFARHLSDLAGLREFGLRDYNGLQW